MQSCQGLVRVRAEPNVEQQHKLVEEACLYSTSVLLSSVNFFSVLCMKATFPISVIEVCFYMFS